MSYKKKLSHIVQIYIYTSPYTDLSDLKSSLEHTANARQHKNFVSEYLSQKYVHIYIMLLDIEYSKAFSLKEKRENFKKTSVNKRNGTFNKFTVIRQMALLCSGLMTL